MLILIIMIRLDHSLSILYYASKYVVNSSGGIGFLYPFLCACAFIFKRNFVLGFNMDLKDHSRLSQVLSSSPVLLQEFVPHTEEIPTPCSPNSSKNRSRLLKQSSSFDLQNVVKLDVKNESRVLVLYTGGTIGMIRNAQGALVPGILIIYFISI